MTVFIYQSPVPENLHHQRHCYENFISSPSRIYCRYSENVLKTE